MSFGKSKTKSSQQGTSQTTVNPWSQQQYDTQSKGMMDAVNNYNSQPFKPYTGQMVADRSALQDQARTTAQGNVGNYSGLLGSAQDSVTGAMGYDGTDVSRWYNPYQKDVVDATGAYMDQNLQQNLTQNNARATQAGAFGGSRHGVADAELMRSSGMDKAKMMADLRYQGYGDARNAGFQNQKAQYEGAGLLSGLASQKQQMGANDVSMLSQLGATDREIEQAKLLAQRAEFDRSAKDQYDKLILELQTRKGILGATPITTNTNLTGSGSESKTSFGASVGFGPAGFTGLTGI